MKPFILLTNDDGWKAPGLQALWQELDDEFEVMVVAPLSQRSWIGKAVTNPGPLTVETRNVAGKDIWVVNDGMPADCTNLGIFHLAPVKPDLVLSGINNGGNVTNSLTLSSGTVGGALEAALNGIFGIAVSLNLDPATEDALHSGSQTLSVKPFAPAARAVKQFLRFWLGRSAGPHIKLVNLIIPQHFDDPPRFIECVPLQYEYGSIFERRGDAFYNRGRGFFPETAAITENSDVWTVQHGMIAYTCYSGSLDRISSQG